jgi:hypothetical protein
MRKLTVFLGMMALLALVALSVYGNRLFAELTPSGQAQTPASSDIARGQAASTTAPVADVTASVTTPLAQAAPDARGCPASPITTERPANSNTAAWSKTWYRSPDGAIWASETGLRKYTGKSSKVLWAKPAGSRLQVQGRRLDGEAPPLGVHMPCCYPDDYQASGLTFPTPGCWEIEAKAARAEWRFVVYIAPGPE